VLVAGAFGQGNPGDQSVLEAFVSHLAGCDVAATVSGPVGADPGYRPVPTSDRRQVARAVLEADLTVATATVLKTLHPSTGRPRLSLLSNTMAVAGVTRLLGRPAALAGVGAGDLSAPGASALARGIVAACGTVEIRDEESVDVLRRAGVRGPLAVGADVVWATVPVAVTPRSASPVAVMAMSHLAGGTSLVESLRTTVMALVGAGYHVVLHPWQPVEDAAMTTAVASGLPVRIWAPPADVAAAAADFTGVALVLGCRFHSLVAAGAAGVPFVAVAHEPKLMGLARRLQQPAVAPSVGPAELAELAVRTAGGAPPPVELVERERQRAVATLERIRALAFTRRGLDAMF
jgi:polysaccharide pyruvyl transferase WcaK-like protein